MCSCIRKLQFSLTGVRYFFSNADIRYLSSSETSPGPQICQGNIIGVGNSGIECPYKKVEMGKVEFRNIVQNVDTSKKDDLVESLINFLKSRKRYAKKIYSQCNEYVYT